MSWQQYAAAWAGQHGGYDVRRAPAPVRGWLWSGYTVARGLARLRTPPGAVFLVGLVVAAAVPVAAGRGSTGPLGGAVLIALASFLRTLDGALTVLTTGASARGAIRATVAARATELAGLAGFWVLGVPPALLLVCGVLAALHELARREALACGLSPVGLNTVGEHPTRLCVAVTGLGLAGLVGRVTATGDQLAAGLLTVAAVVWLAFALTGAGQLVGVVRRALP